MQPSLIITGPLHAHGARTAEEYLDRQRQHIAQLKAVYRQHEWRDPWKAGCAVARVSGGRWIVDCQCGNAPSASPAWRLAACFECGAVYGDVVFPADLERIEAILLLRPVKNRHWSSKESADDLLRENATHGCEVP